MHKNLGKSINDFQFFQGSKLKFEIKSFPGWSVFMLSSYHLLRLNRERLNRDSTVFITVEVHYGIKIKIY